jgi:hypothetical protein
LGDPYAPTVGLTRQKEVTWAGRLSVELRSEHSTPERARILTAAQPIEEDVLLRGLPKQKVLQARVTESPLPFGGEVGFTR